jgi:PTH1 family peptidyl-tRNA hydrolase
VLKAVSICAICEICGLSAFAAFPPFPTSSQEPAPPTPNSHFSMKHIVGRGNPGLKYRRTRHNFGFMVVEALADQRDLRFHRGKFRGMEAAGQIGKEQVLLVKPLTYMNLSGECVGGLMRYYQCDLQDVLVICDDIHLDLGKLRLRRSGSAGGHNGLESVLKHLHTQEFPRLRLGVGQPPEWMDMMSYVLSPFPRGEAKVVAETIDRATLAVETWLYHGIDETMNRFN